MKYCIAIKMSIMNYRNMTNTEDKVLSEKSRILNCIYVIIVVE